MDEAGRFSAACHEAGHAVVAWALGLKIGDLHAGVGDDDWAGRAHIEDSTNLPVIDRLAICFAGIVRQEILQAPVLDLAGFGDHVEVMNILDSIEADEQKGLRLREAAQQRAKDLLLLHRTKLTRLAERLAAEGYLSSEAVEQILIEVPMHDELWAGIASKLQTAEFHLHGMKQSLQPPKRSAINAVLDSSGAIDTGWQRAFYAYLDAFLSAARSVPEIIRCCFGIDRGHPEMKAWFYQLDPDERIRREEFTNQFKTAYDSFRKLDLGRARHISEHRSGYAPVKAKITGFFGVIYEGSPVKLVPISETRPVNDPEHAFLARPIEVRPNWQDFKIDGKLLFEECQEYLSCAAKLIDEARTISDRVHGTKPVTPPPV
jgi:hypothetical protein